MHPFDVGLQPILVCFTNDTDEYMVSVGANVLRLFLFINVHQWVVSLMTVKFRVLGISILLYGWKKC